MVRVVFKSHGMEVDRDAEKRKGAENISNMQVIKEMPKYRAWTFLFLMVLWTTKDAGKFVSRVAKQSCKPTLALDTFSKMVRILQSSRPACRVTDTVDFG